MTRDGAMRHAHRLRKPQELLVENRGLDH